MQPMSMANFAAKFAICPSNGVSALGGGRFSSLGARSLLSVTWWTFRKCLLPYFGHQN